LTLLLCGGFTQSVEASKIVEFDTVMGTFDVELFDDTPLHQANFIDNYVTPGLYNNSFFHRLTTPSTGLEVLQGGGFTFDYSRNEIDTIASAGTVNNEFSAAHSNVRGTLALARPPSGLDSGSNQWFFNLADNSAALDPQSFTVFGQVLGNGMDILDAIAALPIESEIGQRALFFPNYDGQDKLNIMAAFGELPVQSHFAVNGLPGLGQDIVLINSVTELTGNNLTAAMQNYGLGGTSNAIANPEPGAIVLGIMALAGFGLFVRCRKI
jgi:cyclophilin family peptidyl-prolyl cis-trans isomerase